MATYTKLPSGHWRAMIRKTGIYRSKTFPLKREAMEWAIAQEGQAASIISSGYQPVVEGYTVGMLINEYIADTKEGAKTKTATLAMLKRELGHISLRTLNSIHLRDFIDKRLKTAGGVTIAGDLSFFGGVLKWGKHSRKMDLPVNLALDARADLSARKISTRSMEREREPTDEDMKRLYARWENSQTQIIPMVTLCKFALSTAMRLSEICNLLLEDINIEKREVIIRDRKDPQKKQGNNQTVPLLPLAWAIIEPVLKERRTGFVFPYSAPSVSTAFTRACKALGIIDLHFHDLRHKATGDLFKLGLDIRMVSILTGHKSWKMLSRYTHTKAEDIHQFLANMK